MTSTAQGHGDPPYLPNVEHDIFISYRHVADSDPWMDALYTSLKLELGKRLGRISMFRDSAALVVGDRWRSEIERRVQSSPVFLAVLSDPYFASKECLEELGLFLERLGSPGASGTGLKLVPILRLPVDHPVMTRDLQAFEHKRFFEQPGEGQPARELNPRRADDPESRFYEAVVGLADALRLMLRQLEGDICKHMDAVYLATVGAGDDRRRENLAHDLTTHDVLPLPDGPYMWSSASLRDDITRHLEAALLSLFVVPAGGDAKSRQRLGLQLDLAIAVSKRLHRPKPMVWIPPGDDSGAGADELVDRIRHELAGEIELFDSSGFRVEDFKNEVYDTLAQRERNLAATASATPKPVAVTVLMAEPDIEASVPLLDCLLDELQLDPQRCVVTQAAPLAHHAARLADCTACIVVWGACDESWLQTTIDDPALAGLRARGALALHPVGPIDAFKRTFRQRNVQRLPEDGLAAGLRAFLGALETSL